MMMARDYYKILGVKETDSKDTIKKAYREAVKRLHPDVRRGEFDKNRFYEIQEAYEILGDEERRRQYDASRDAASPRQKRVHRMEEVFPNGWDLLDAWTAFWGNRPPFYERFSDREERKVLHRATVTLAPEEARRGIQMTLRVPLKRLCSLCGGRGTIGLFTCPLCEGEGGILREVPMRVAIPPGVEDGARIEIPFEDEDGTQHVVILLIEIDWLS